MVDECSNLEDSLFLQSLSVRHTENSLNIAANLTSISLAGCQCITSTFVRRLTHFTRSNLKSINISYTAVDCTALVYLAGYTLSTAVEMANLSHLGETVLKDVEVNKELNKQFLEVDSSEHSFSSSQICEHCTKEKAKLNKISTVDSWSEYDIVESWPAFCTQSSADGYDEWDVISLEDVKIEVNKTACTCEVQPEAMPNSKEQTGEAEAALKQLFLPKLVCLDITNINFYDDDFGKRCLELFLRSNQSLQQFYASWSKLDNDMLGTIAKNEVNLKSLSLVGTNL